jgi:glycosyltransferase involved in cell wall biosynthesis
MGGAERYLVNLSEGLLDEGHEVTIILVEAKGPLLADVDKRCRMIVMNKTRVIKSISSLTSIFKENSPDVIISFQTHMNVSTLIAMALAKTTVPVIITEHAPIANHLNIGAPMLTRIKNGVMLTLVKNLYKRANKFIGVSTSVAQQYAEFSAIPRQNVRVIATPIVTPMLLMRAAQAPTHPWLIEKTHPVIISMGRLVGEKDQATLIRAFGLLRKQMNARMIIFGEGVERKNLEEIIQNLGIGKDVDLPGEVLNPFREMSQADLYVHSAKLEGFGNVLVEALACGLPVIATDCPVGPREILSDGQYGVLTPVGDEYVLAKEMYRVLNMSKLEKDRIINAGKERANEFTLNHSVKSYMDIIREL